MNKYLDGKRYYSFGQHLKEHFGEKVYKVSLDGGFTCPNRDGTLGHGGCTFCSQDGSLAPGADPYIGLKEQIEKGKVFLGQRYGAKKFLAYFQSFSNTYGDVLELEKKYRLALNQKDIVGLSVATRPDCVPDKTLDLIADISKDHYTWLEFGLQTMHDNINKSLNRLHTFKDFVSAVERAHKRNLRICAHIILFLPGETRKHMEETIQTLSKMPVTGIKVHLLHVIKKTALASQHAKGEISLPSQKEYVETVADFVELLPPHLIIQRLTGETSKEEMIAPLWALNKNQILKEINDTLIQRNTCQGSRFY
ncbi:MAG: TIGR01212 family radical SAM protein [Deltaproteobacteria bacterium]|nr:TIGR01212 family radical SAM protein [Deltaproteobacteria bacterium]